MTATTTIDVPTAARRFVRERPEDGPWSPGAHRRDRARRAGESQGPSLAVRFSLGQLVATPGALDALTRTGENPLRYLARHATGDWGDVGADDHAANDRALVDGERLLSAYRLADGTRIWIITEADRSVSTLLLPEEY
jgi:hypothetical protein